MGVGRRNFLKVFGIGAAAVATAPLAKSVAAADKVVSDTGLFVPAQKQKELLINNVQPGSKVCVVEDTQILFETTKDSLPDPIVFKFDTDKAGTRINVNVLHHDYMAWTIQDIALGDVEQVAVNQLFDFNYNFGERDYNRFCLGGSGTIDAVGPNNELMDIKTSGSMPSLDYYAHTGDYPSCLYRDAGGLRADRTIDSMDVSFFMDEVATRGSVVTCCDDDDTRDLNVDCVRVQKGNESPCGILLDDVVEIDLMNRQCHFGGGEVMRGGKVHIMRQGIIMTRPVGDPRPGDHATAHDGYISNNCPQGVRIGTFLTGKDEDGFAKISITSV